MATSSMTQENGITGPSPRAYVLMGAALCLGAFAAVLATFLYWNTGIDQEPVLQPPDRLIATSTENLSSVLATALQEQERTSNRYVIRVPKQDNASFRMHLENAAAQRGWYTHGSTEYQLRIVLPEHELGQLDELREDPMGWIRRESARTGPAVGPSSLRLTNASLGLSASNPRHKQRLSLVAGISIGALLGGLGIGSIVVAAGSHLDRRRTADANGPKGRKDTG